MTTDVRVAVLFGFGINCDRETAAVFDMVGGISERLHVNHLVQENRSLEEFDILAVPGGFSFGDHLGSGRLLGNRLRFALRDQLQKFVNSGKPIIGICNGFQILIEAGLLPGVLLRNKRLRFLSKDVYLNVANTDNYFCLNYKEKKIIKLPIAHNEGNYFAKNELLKKLNDKNLIAFKYCDENGNINKDSNPNGSSDNIAGILNSEKNILGMMPHPERMIDEYLSGDDGSLFFENLLNNLN